MRQTLDLNAQPRQKTGKGPSYQTRQKGLIPAIIYGGADAPENISVDGRTLERHVGAGGFLTTLFMLDIEGKKTRVIPRQLQLDPVSDRPVHVDFMRLGEGAKIRIAVPVHFKGQDVSPGLKRGGVLNIVRHEVELLCPVESIPDHLEADLSTLDVHGTLHIGDFQLPEGATPTIRRENFTIASIVAPTSMREEQRAAASGGAAEAAPAEAAKAPAAGAKAPAAGAKAPAAGAKADAPKKK